MRDHPAYQFFRASFRASFWGGAAGGGPFMLLTVPAVIYSPAGGETGAAFYLIALVPFAIAIGVTLAAMLVVIVPLTTMLSALDMEHHKAYPVAGLLFGIVIPIAASSIWLDTLAAGILLAIPGMGAGVTACTLWGRWRQSRVIQHGNEEPAEPHHNPIHELIY